ncbi:2-trimethylaminoethylphosphonate dioxygenase [Virgifigura deserti]|uniref:2-trimethylaminoethylphosphonate dioxygenase n=1 Tax=Virgifigura deserti TaxID=2268457 RepID=UPI003CCC41D4
MSRMQAVAARLARPGIAGLRQDAETLTIGWADGRESRFAAIWLFDNRPDGRHGPDGQRLFDVAELPDEVGIASVELTGEGDVAVTFAPNSVATVFSGAWLRDHALDPASRAERRLDKHLWDKGLAANPPTAAYAEVVKGGRALADWLAHIRDYGFALLSGVPAEDGMVCRVVELFGYVRETNYGRLFDVISVEKPNNLAFTGLALGNHTDNPYRDPVPQLQLLHCLQAAEEGGESVVVDGFFAAERLRREAPEAFNLLTRYAVPFRYVEKGAVDLRAAAPLIELDSEGDLRAVRYNNRSAAPFDLPEETVVPFYQAYRRFGRLLHDPAAIVSFRLGAGDLFIVDNQRVLHGRRGFGKGRRHLQGTYADKDGLLSRLRVLEASL